MQRWVYATEHLPDLLGAAAPKWVLKYVAPSTIKKQLHAQGMGRHTPKEVQHIGEIDMDAIEAFLGMSIWVILPIYNWTYLVFPKLYWGKYGVAKVLPNQISKYV